ncbi:TIR domain-containing protein [Salinarimonas chemoclinalis]|uniref:TIR domain-containing protein n=1 Tax=Salinarimonas chemoclinalis TaxID=3241599 RepID=UPI0035561A3A
MDDHYDVAVSYASKDIDTAEQFAARLRQDGIRCFYNPSKLHKLLGMPLTTELTAIFEARSEVVLVLLSRHYVESRWACLEFAAAIRGGSDRIIVVRLDDVPLPTSVDGTAVPEGIFDSSFLESVIPTEIAARIVSAAVSERIGPKLIRSEPQNLSSNLMCIDHPTLPYGLDDVHFLDSGEDFIIDLHGEVTDSLASRLSWLVERSDIETAMSRVRASSKEREEAGWPIFNGGKFGVKQILKRRDPESERHRLDFILYRTDYHTHLIMRHIYNSSRRKAFFIDTFRKDEKMVSPLLTSFGFCLLLFAQHDGRPHVLLTKRSSNVAQPSDVPLWHVSMNEGLSSSDRWSEDFSALPTVFRGFAEELNLPRSGFARVELLEAILWKAKFEIGILGVAYSTLPMEDIIGLAQTAGDRLLEIDDLRILRADERTIADFLHDPNASRTDLLEGLLSSILRRNMLA